MSTTLPRYLTTAEVGQIIGASPDYVARQCERGALKGKKIGREWRIHPADVETFMGSGGKAPATRPERRAAR